MTQVWVAVATVGIPAVAGLLGAMFRLQSRPHRELTLMGAEIDLLAKFPDDHPARESVSSSLSAHAAEYEKRSQPKVARRDRAVAVLTVATAGVFFSVLGLLVLYQFDLIEIRQTITNDRVVTVECDVASDRAGAPDCVVTSDRAVTPDRRYGPTVEVSPLAATILAVSVLLVFLVVIGVWVLRRQRRH